MRLFFSINLSLLFVFVTIIASKPPVKSSNPKNEKNLVEMVYVPGGAFIMGQGDTLIDDFHSKPYKTEVLPYYISRYEITLGQLIKVYNWGLRHNYIEGCCRSMGNGGEQNVLLFDYGFNT